MEIVKKEIDELINLIERSSLYQNYKHILEQMDKNKDLNRLIEEIKELQKKAVNEEYHHLSAELDETEILIQIRIRELNSVPLYQEYLLAAEELNDLIGSIKNNVQSSIDKL